jgi:hypothetical protein
MSPGRDALQIFAFVGMQVKFVNNATVFRGVSREERAPSDAALVARRAAEVGSTPTFTDYRQMLATTGVGHAAIHNGTNHL